ncbi:flavin-containing monooxygenase-like protein [Sphingobium sp. MI1205]|nr:flavin-containing monooxygenase-like protein [Sphingobium sp. MI1205]
MTEALRGADDGWLRKALAAADPMVLMGLIYHATQDGSLDRIETQRLRVGLSEATIVPDESDLATIRDKAFALLRGYRDGTISPPSAQDEEVLRHAMSLAAGDPVPIEEMDLHRDVLALQPKVDGWDNPPACGNPAEFSVLVIGAGLAGINAAVQLKASGLSFELFDRNAGPGGTWQKNRYPGARVDWPSRLYSHSFGATFPFRHGFAPRAEMEEYLQWCVEEYDLADHIRYGMKVDSLVWSEDRGEWTVSATDAQGNQVTRNYRAVISAIGLLDRPKIPAIAGMADFRGKVMHSSLFDPETDLTGKRVAVLGTGASGLQMVPDLAPLVAQLTVFQRSPAWVVPAHGYRQPLSEEAQWLDANVPYYANWTRFALGWVLGDHRLLRVFDVDADWDDPLSSNPVNREAREFALAHIRQALADRPDLLEKSIPDYPIFANRPVVDNGWFDALKRDNVELVTDGVARFTEGGIATVDGIERQFDIVVMATGFDPNNYFAEIDIVGRGGKRIADLWADTGPQAFWGIAAPNMPNFFMLYGPNANPRNLGPVQYGEWAITYILDLLAREIENNWKSVEISEQVYRDFNAELEKRLLGIVSVNPKTTHASYYITTPGRSAVQSPWTSREVHDAFAKVNLGDFRVEAWNADSMTSQDDRVRKSERA